MIRPFIAEVEISPKALKRDGITDERVKEIRGNGYAENAMEGVRVTKKLGEGDGPERLERRSTALPDRKAS